MGEIRAPALPLIQGIVLPIRIIGSELWTGRVGKSLKPYLVFSPARIAIGRRFSFGGKGQS